MHSRERLLVNNCFDVKFTKMFIEIKNNCSFGALGPGGSGFFEILEPPVAPWTPCSFFTGLEFIKLNSSFYTCVWMLVVRLARCSDFWHWCCWCCSASILCRRPLTSDLDHHRRSTTMRQSCHVDVWRHCFRSWGRRQAVQCCQWSGSHLRPRLSVAQWCSVVASSRSPGSR